MKAAQARLRDNGGSIFWQDQVRQLQVEVEDMDRLVQIQPPHELGECSERCPLHADGRRHDHHILYDTSRAVQSLVALIHARNDQEEFVDQNLKDSEGNSILSKLQEENRLYYAYLPLQLFGTSPHVNLSRRKTRLLQGVIRELTRRPSRRRYRAHERSAWVNAARVRAPRDRATVQCPYLDPDRRYVQFCGNLRKEAGRGYALIGQTNRGWLHRAGYVVDESVSQETVWEFVGYMLDDLAAVAEDFHLIVCGLDRQGVAWKSLGEMRQMLRTPSGRRWLDACRMRIYAPENYRVLWRHWFARRLGFSFIPGGKWDMPVDAPKPSRFGTPEGVRAWLTQQGLTQQRLARDIGRSPGLVSQYLSGAKPWSSGFQTLIEGYAASTERA